MSSLSPECYSPAGLGRYHLFPEKVDFSCRMAMDSIAQHVSVPALVTYLPIFFLTCGLEAPFYLAAFGRRWKSALPALLICNLATHPLVHFAFPQLGPLLDWPYAHILTAAEVFAPLVEALLLVGIWQLRPVSAFGPMLAGNLASWWIGIYF